MLNYDQNYNFINDINYNKSYSDLQDLNIKYDIKGNNIKIEKKELNVTSSVEDMKLNGRDLSFFKYLNQKAEIRNEYLIEDLLNQEVFNIENENLKSGKKNYKAPKFFVILIQVHSRLNYLKELIKSLKITKYIEQTLVIFSHDLYSKEMNDVIKKIDFCAVNITIF